MTPPYESRFAIRTLAIVDTGFTDVKGLAVLPINCNEVIVYNDTGTDILLRSDPSNSASEVTVAAGQYFPIGTPQKEGGFRFPQNCPPVCALKSTSGALTIIVESLN